MDECCKDHCSTKNESCHEQECDVSETEFFLEVADCAWTEVLKDEIKKYILATQGDRMKELAKIVAEGNNQVWKSKMDKKKNCKEFEERLCQFFSQHKG